MSFVSINGIFVTLKHSAHLKTPENKIKNTLLQQCRYNGKERAFVSAFHLKASLTIEAAIALPIFLLFALGIVSILMILSLQTQIQAELEETARGYSRMAYGIERCGLELGTISPALCGISLKTGRLKSTLDDSWIEGGSAGLNLMFSSYDNEEGILDLVVQYKYKIPFLPETFPSLMFTQRTRCRMWIGRELDSSGADGDSSHDSNKKKENTVYVTPHGSVYHTSKDCHYLDLSIHTINAEEIETMRNKNGAKYYHCPLCAKGNMGASGYYVTDYGENWHTSLNCSGLKRTIEEKDRSEIDGLPLCSKCGHKG